MKVLIAAADPVLQALVVRLLAAPGRELQVAAQGLEALQRVRDQVPDLVITHSELPEIDGLELSRLIRLASRRRIVPILMLAPSSSPALLRQRLEAGILEIILCPFAPEELQFRVDALERLIRLQNELLAKQARDREEVALVKHVLDRLSAPGNQPMPPGFHMETLQTQRINGDVCVHREGLPGVHFGLICDATGHGLMAGVSTIPVVETFLAMVARDLPLDAIYREIHAKLKHLLPTGRFACLLLWRLDVAQGVLAVLNAGMPPALLLRRSGAIQAFPSRVLPAGIAGVEAGVAVTKTGAAPGDRLLAFSDGLGDLAPAGDLEQRFLRSPAGTSHTEHCQAIRELIQRGGGGREPLDDISWALWEVPAPASIALAWKAKDAPAPLALRAGFEARFTLDPRRHSPQDLVPQVLGLLQGSQAGTVQGPLLGMLLTEALTNALDHGLLKLDSRLKAQGFETYEAHRKAALANLESGSLTLTLTLMHDAGAMPPVLRRVQVEVEDTGAGFDWQSWLAPAGETPLRTFGRGIALLAALGQDLTFNEAGNRVSFHLDCP